MSRKPLLIVFAAALVCACSSDDTSTDGDTLQADATSTSDGTSTSDATTTTTSDATTTAETDTGTTTEDTGSGGYPTCSAPEDCPYWYCECETGPPVNSRRCTNNTCEDAAQSCPGACAGFSTCWLGIADGGFPEGSNAGPTTCTEPDPDPEPEGCADGTTFGDLGRPCSQNTSCESRLCYGANPSYICTKRCESADDCPEGWYCSGNSDGFDTCTIGGNKDGSPSTNDTCEQVTFSDLGEACSQHGHCQSGLCLNSGYCSKRCSRSSDCPSGWSCQTGNSVGLDFCVQ